jgi:hypothetical protein
MVTTNTPIALRPTLDDLCRNNTQIVHVRARAPGSLGQSVRDGGDWKIGSLDVKVRVNDLYEYSVFVFESGKIKISGGSRDYLVVTAAAAGNYETWLDSRVVVPILTTLKLQGTRYETRLCLLNGSFTLDSRLMNMSNYRFVCERIGHDLKDPRFASSFESLVLPSRLILPKKRGRICSMSLKYKKKGTLRFDHGGKVQLFAFKSLDDMSTGTELLVALLETVNSKV